MFHVYNDTISYLNHEYYSRKKTEERRYHKMAAAARKKEQEMQKKAEEEVLERLHKKTCFSGATIDWDVVQI